MPTATTGPHGCASAAGAGRRRPARRRSGGRDAAAAAAIGDRRRRSAAIGPPATAGGRARSAEVGAEVLGRLVARSRVLRHRGEHDAVERARDVGLALATAATGRLAHVLVRDRHRAVAGERRDAGEHLVEHDAERVHVGAAVEREALRLLGREVGGGADHRAGLGEAVARASARAMPKSVTFTWPCGVMQHVAGLDVAVHDAVPVRERRARRRSRRRCRRPRPAPTVRLRAITSRSVWPATYSITMKEVSLLLAPVVDRDDVRVVQARGGLRLAPEALDERGVARRARRESTFTATGRSSRRSCARYTSAMPPRPISRTSS